jgi:ribokinase
MSFEVVIVGSCMTDLVSYVPRLPKPGETIRGHSFNQGFGGKGANQCIMATRLGATTAMVAKLGNDSFGHSTVKNFKDNGVNVDYVSIIDNVPSGVAPITVNDQGDNSIVIVSGANDCLGVDDVAMATSLISQAKVVICQLEVPLVTTLAALKVGKDCGAVTLFNAAPGSTELTKEFYQFTDILCVNETEAEIITGISVTDIESAHTAVKMLQLNQPGCVVLTMGGSGVVFTDLDDMTNDNIHHIPAVPVDVVDTTGAGDAFVGALAFYLAKYTQLSFSEKIRRSSIIASRTVMLHGTQTSFITNSLPHDLFN